MMGNHNGTHIGAGYWQTGHSVAHARYRRLVMIGTATLCGTKYTQKPIERNYV
jgi:hypothetical protein